MIATIDTISRQDHDNRNSIDNTSNVVEEGMVIRETHLALVTVIVMTHIMTLTRIMIILVDCPQPNMPLRKLQSLGQECYVLTKACSTSQGLADRRAFVASCPAYSI